MLNGSQTGKKIRERPKRGLEDSQFLSMVENLRCVPRCASIFQRMKELIIDIFKYGWKHIGGTVLGIIILVYLTRKIIDARRRHLRALERANAPGPQPIADLDLELDKRDKSRPKDSREIDLPRREKKPSKTAVKEKKEQLSSELDALLESGSGKKKTKKVSPSQAQAKKASASSAAKAENSSHSKKNAATARPKKKIVTKEELKKSLKEELKAELRAELKAELRAEIESTSPFKPRPKRKMPPTQHGELGPAFTIDPAAVDHILPNRRRSMAQSEPEPKVAAETHEVTPTSSPDTAPIAASTFEREQEPEETAGPVAAPVEPAPAPVSPAPVTPGSVRPQQPAPVAPPAVAATALPAQTSSITPKSFETPEPAAPKGLLSRFFRPKNPREHIGQRLPIKRGKLKGRYGTIVSVEGNVVMISDKSGKTTTVDAGDF